MTKEEKQKNTILLTYDQIRELAKEVEEYGEEGFLINRKCIKIENGERFVMQYEGLTGKPADFGYDYETDIPYVFWSIVLRQVENYMRREEKKAKQLAKMEGYAD